MIEIQQLHKRFGDVTAGERERRSLVPLLLNRVAVVRWRALGGELVVLRDIGQNH